MAFPPAFLEELAARNPIEDVVGRYVSLTRKSSNLFGLCPFHSEKTPSFSVAPAKGIYYCFGCHKGGGVINFIMEIENLDYPDAVRFLAKQAGMEVPEDETYRRVYQHQERLRHLCRDSARYFHEQLNGPKGQPGRDYIAKRRLSKATVTKFGLGYAPNEWGGLMDAMTARGYTKEELLEAGLAVKHETKGTIYDRFRNRVMFPIIDVKGNVIGFGGRVLDDSKPKYLNSPETSIFNKRKNLFALNIAKKSKEGCLILTEGYMDAIALHQYGFDCAVASLGTALTEEHAVILAKYTDKLILTYDGDEAGQNATRRAIPMLEKAGLTVKILQMQGAKDPDEFLKTYGPDAFRALLNKSEGQAEYRLNAISRKYTMADDEQRVAFLQEAAAFIGSLYSPVEREVYGARAAKTAGVTAETMKLEIEKAHKKYMRQKKFQQERKDMAASESRQPAFRKLHYENLRSAMAEEGLLRLLYKEPQLFSKVSVIPEQFSSPVLEKVFAAWRQAELEDRPIRLDSLGDALTPEETAHISAVLQKNDQPVSEEAMESYLHIIREEFERRHDTGRTGEERLRAIQQRKKTDKNGGM